MTQRLARIAVLQTSLTVTLLYVVLTAVFAIPIGLIAMVLSSGADRVKALGMLFAPVLYGVVGFIFTMIGCGLYNLVAKWTGGVAFTITDTGP